MSSYHEEDYLPALCLGILAPKIHDLVRLGDLVDAPAEVKPGLATLNDVLTIVRYPDFTDLAPVDAVTRDEAAAHLTIAAKVLEWIRDQLQ